MPHNSPKVLHVDVAATEDGQRLDNWLLARLKNVPRSHVYRMIRSGQVRVNKGRAKAMQRVRTGDVIRVPPVRRPAPAAVQVSEQWQATIRDAVLYRDDDLLVINKPSGLAMHGGTGVAVSLVDIIRAIWGEGWQPVHRLDRETSGCVLCTRKRERQHQFQQALAEGRVTKQYRALVHGRWAYGTERIESLVTKGGDDDEGGDARARLAISEFRAEQELRGCTVMSVTIETGRTHQIRIQAAERGHPLVGDSRYGSRQLDKDLNLPKRPRLCLHAMRLAVDLGTTSLDVSAEVPADMAAVIHALENDDAAPV